MKAYKIELLVIDHENIGVCKETFKYNFEYYSSRVMSVQGEDIGEWHDNHPLNYGDEKYYQNLFKNP